MGCIGTAELTMTDAAGNAASPSGEMRWFGEFTTRAFDCTQTSELATAETEADCTDGVLLLAYTSAGTERFEVRFRLESGEFSSWQEVPLEYTSYTDPDFNGPGCACTSYDGVAEIVVPEDAL